MSVRKQSRKAANGQAREFWIVDIKYRHADGRIERVRQVPRPNTKARAEVLERELLSQLAAGTYGKKEAPESIPTLSEFEEEFLKTCTTNNNKPSELASKRRIMANHLVPYFGSMNLDSISVREVEAYKARKAGENLSKKSVNNHLAVLAKLLRVAADFGMVPEHTAKNVRLVPLKKTTEMEFLDFREAERLVAAVTCPKLKAMVIVALNTGLRIGELLALRWNDVDLVAGRLVVRRNLDDEGNEVAPKSNNSREVPLNGTALRALKEHRHLRSQIVFCQDDGKHKTRMMAYRPLVQAAKRAGLITNERSTGWHTLRHTFASHLVMRGVPLKIVANLMGHSTTAVTERYAHLTPDITRDAVALLEGQPGGNRDLVVGKTSTELGA